MGETETNEEPLGSGQRPLVWLAGPSGSDAKTVARNLVEMLRDRTDGVVFPVYLDGTLVQWIAGDDEDKSTAESRLARLAYAMWRLGHWVVCAGSTDGLASSKKWLSQSTAKSALLSVWLSGPGSVPSGMDLVLASNGQKTPTEVLANKIVAHVLEEASE